MNSDEMWLLYLFSGLFGAVISGAVAAFVAMRVLGRTIYNQSNEAVKQIAEHRRLATVETKNQDARAALALEMQRQALEKQLQEQRLESALAREVAVRSDLLELTSSFGKILGKNRPVQIRELDRQIAVALHQWRINLSEAQDIALRGELSQWGGLLSDVEVAAGHSDPDLSGHVYLGQALKTMQNVATNYRLVWSSVIWNAGYSTAVLSSARRDLEGFLQERSADQGALDLWANEQREAESKCDKED